MFHHRGLALALGCMASTMVALHEPASAAVVTVLNTGIGAAGPLAEGSVDDAYALLASSDPALSSPALYVLMPEGGSGSFPFGFWLPDAPESRWLVPYLNGNVSAATATAQGSYTIRTTFSLAGFDPATASIEGRWAVDEAGVDIVLNGQSTGQATPAQGFSQFSDLALPNGFVAGLNTLDFVFTNIDQVTGNPIGLRVEASVHATALQSSVAEPSTIAMLALALGALARRGVRSGGRLEPA